jgi:glycosyltransferase involved in cell wall biosynthesis
MFKLHFIHRNRNAGHSIYSVFNSIISNFKGLAIVEEHYAPNYRVKIVNLISNGFYFFSRVRSADLVHITGDIHYCALFLLNRRVVLTIHDVSEEVSNGDFRSFIYRFFWYFLPLKRADLVTCVSNKTKEDLVANFPFVAKKLVVVPNPIRINNEYIPKVFNKNRPRILLVGTARNKNLIRVIHALSFLTCEVRIIGVISDELEMLLNDLEVVYSSAFDLTDDEMTSEYINCDVLVFASTFEGFGLPIIEAQALGRVVLTSNIEPMIGVSGGNAFFVNPQNIDSIRAGLIDLINNDSKRERMILEGLKNIRRFDLEVVSNQYFSAYKKLLQ